MMSVMKTGGRLLWEVSVKCKQEVVCYDVKCKQEVVCYDVNSTSVNSVMM